MADAPSVDSPVVLFDGVCNLCNGAVRFLLRHDATGDLRFASLQSDVGGELLAACGLDPDDRTSMVLVTADGCFRKSAAAVRIARHLTLPYRLLAWLRIVPRPLRDLGYDLVARSRYRVFGRRDTCARPPPEAADRFLDGPDR